MTAAAKASFTERHVLLVVALALVGMVLAGIAIGQGVGFVGVRVADAVADRVASAD